MFHGQKFNRLYFGEPPKGSTVSFEKLELKQQTYYNEIERVDLERNEGNSFRFNALAPEYGEDFASV